MKRFFDGVFDGIGDELAELAAETVNKKVAQVRQVAREDMGDDGDEIVKEGVRTLIKLGDSFFNRKKRGR